MDMYRVVYKVHKFCVRKYVLGQLTVHECILSERGKEYMCVCVCVCHVTSKMLWRCLMFDLYEHIWRESLGRGIFHP